MQKLLEQLEASGEYVFHGSSAGDIAQLEPRQACSNGIPDGAPAVFASSDITPAIFMAIIGSRKAGGWDTDGTTHSYFVQEDVWEQACQEEWSGYVYALGRSSFKKIKGLDWCSEIAVQPQEVVKVTSEDLPDNIKILTEDKAS